MKRRLFLFVLFISVFCPVVKGQLKHSLSCNVTGYYEFFNEKKDNIFATLAPSYKIEKKRIGLEVFFIWWGVGYHYGANSGPEYEKPPSIRQIIASNIGLTFHYNFLDTQNLKISLNSGLVRCKYDATIINGWGIYPGWNEPIIEHNTESRLGIITGLNINVPVFKGAYFNTDIRYTIFPAANFNKQNLIMGIGIGYMYQNKKKQRL